MEHGIDLHVHSTFSDGTCTPEELVRIAKSISLSAIALTDHDTVSGLPLMKKYCEESKISFVPGIELSTTFTFPEKKKEIEVHMLGFYIDDTNSELLDFIREFHHNRETRNEQMIQRLQEHGFSITIESLKNANPNSVLTRAHIARYLLDTNQVKSMNEAFQKYLGDHCPCYVSRKRISSQDAISLIHRSSGVAVIAHPPLYNLPHKDLDNLINALAQSGLDGIEAYYSTYHNDEQAQMLQFANQYHLICTGGSDFHGSNKPYIHLGTGRGNLFVHDSLYDKLYDFYKTR